MIALVIILGYICSGLLLARHLYRTMRPLKVPTICDYSGPYPQHHTHDSWCYRQPGFGKAMMIDSQSEAAVFGLLGGLLWPLLMICLALRFAVIAGNNRQRPDEMRQRISDLESELGMRRD